MPDDVEEDSKRKLAKETLDRWKKAADEEKKGEKPPGVRAPEPGQREGKNGKKSRSTLDDLDAFMADLISGKGAGTAKQPTEIEQLYSELDELEREDPRQRQEQIKGRLADIEREKGRASLKGAPKEVEEEEEEEIDLGDEGELDLDQLEAMLEPEEGEEQAKAMPPPLAPPAAPIPERPAQRPEPGEGLVLPGRVNGGRVNGGRVNGGRVNGGRVNGGRVNSGRVNGGRVNGGRVNGGRVNGGRVNGGRVNGGRVNGGRVNGGRVNGGRVNGGRVNGGRVNGGRVNGGYTNGLQAIPRRIKARNRLVAAALAVAIFAGLILPLYISFSAPAIVRVDGNFDDWVGYSIVTDSPNDQSADPNIDLVGFAARADERSLYFYLQVTQQGRIFDTTGSATGATAYGLLIDSDRDAATGYLAFGLGADFLISLSGFEGKLEAGELESFSAGALDRTDARGFTVVAAVSATPKGNQLEGAVPLTSLALRSGDRPHILVLAQDTAGNVDVGDAVFTTLPGVLKLVQDGTLPSVIPATGEIRLFIISAQAEGADVRLLAFNFFVESADGGGIQITRVIAGFDSEPQSGAAFGGSVLRVPITTASMQRFADKSPPKTLEFYGRGIGPNGSVVRVYLRGPADVQTSTDREGAVGLGSVLAPDRFSRAYVGQAPQTVRIDGAFGDWNQTLPADPDPRGDPTSTPSGPSGGGPNSAPYDPGLDLVASRAEVSSTTREVSFFLEVAGSIFSPGELPRPTRPAPAVPSTGGGGVPGPPEVVPATETATIYVDTDANAATGWNRYSGLGVDSIIEIQGAAGGYGRAPRQTQTSVLTWNGPTQNFIPAIGNVSTGFNSSAMEAQTSGAALCGGPCGRVRYVFYLHDARSNGDETAVRDGTARSIGDVLFFDEERTTTWNVYQGDAHQPVLAFTVTAPSTNQEAASVQGLDAWIEGATRQDLPSMAIYADGAPPGSLGAEDLSKPPLAVANTTAAGQVRLDFASPIGLAPGVTFTGLLTVAVAPDATVDTWFNVSIARARSVRSTGVLEVRYGFPSDPDSIRILSATPGSRGQNDLKLNEVNVGQGWVEIYDTTNSGTDLTSTSQISLRVYTYRSGHADVEQQWLDLSGSTNSSGFAVFNITIKAETGPRNTSVELRCNNCSAGGGDNTTYMDRVILPQGATLQWGRYPDGTGTWQNTTNTTRGTTNAIPEFSDFGAPLMGAGLLAAVGRLRRPALRRQPCDPRA